MIYPDFLINLLNLLSNNFLQVLKLSYLSFNLILRLQTLKSLSNIYTELIPKVSD